MVKSHFGAKNSLAVHRKEFVVLTVIFFSLQHLRKKDLENPFLSSLLRCALQEPVIIIIYLFYRDLARD